jgi:hypothetical protein
MCGAAATFSVAEAVDAGRILWTTTSRCTDCGYVNEDRGSPAEFDAVDAIVRQTLVARVGLSRLHVDPDMNRDVRRHALAVFRRRGATIAEVGAAYAALTGPGLTGTPAEMSVLAEHLTAGGVQVTLEHMYERADELRRLLNEWDFIGVFDPATNADEYDCMLSPLLERLAGGGQAGEIQAYLDQELRGHFGMSPERAGTVPMAQRLVAWWSAGSGEQ